MKTNIPTHALPPAKTTNQRVQFGADEDGFSRI
jgi:hypothetical protein